MDVPPTAPHNQLEEPLIDRLTASIEPQRPIAGYHQWLDLSFLHWRIPAQDISPLLPQGLTLDTWEGDAWVGIVPFHMRHVRPWWSPAIPGISNFAETNLRTYVHLQGRDPGVWFFSLDAAKWLAVQIARIGWNLPYYWASMEVALHSDRIEYRSQRFSKRTPAFTIIELDIGEWLVAPGERAAPGSLEHFLVERYLLYTRNRTGRIFQGQVHHAPYPLRFAHCENYAETLSSASGIVLNSPPDHVLYSPGVSVQVYPLREIKTLESVPN